MTSQEIINKVRVIMNEAGEEEELHLLSEDTVKLDVYIDSVIPDAVNLILLLSPIHYINIASSTINVQNINGAGVINLPSDFLKLVAVKLKEWKRAVFMAYPLNSEEYNIQHNSITRTGVNKPVCVLSYNVSGPTIECFPSGSMEYFSYIKSASISNNKGLDILKETLHLAVCYMCASLVYNIFEMPQIGERMKSIAIDLIPKE